MLFLAAFLLLAALLTGCAREEVTVIRSTGTSGENMPGLSLAETETERHILVHVCGAVNAPGVYELSEGARLYEAVAAAGGFCEEADTDWDNQARVLADGEKVRILTAAQVLEREDGAAEGDRSADSTGALTDLNTADLQQLTKLPGIGEKKASAIIAYRDAHGYFTDADELLHVKGIGPSLLERLRPLITW